jgi:hypothetical protein
MVRPLIPRQRFIQTSKGSLEDKSRASFFSSGLFMTVQGKSPDAHDQNHAGNVQNVL